MSASCSFRSQEVGVMTTDDTPLSSISGYYKYTDIVFSYSNAIEDPDDASAFKSFVHYNALGNPAHPLRTDKEKGLALYIGTLPHGQSRLMFSSAQIEYMRYFLHTMGRTSKPLPLPSSEYLLTVSVLTNVSTVYLKTPAEVKKAYAIVKKTNKKLRNDVTLKSYRETFERVREIYASRRGTWMAIDIEAWAVMHSGITEFGWSYIRWDGSDDTEGHGHFIVKENKGLRNGQYVADAQGKYAYGSSVELETSNFKEAVNDLFVKLQKLGPLFLVFHDHRQDMEFLRNTKYFPEGLTDSFLFSLPKEIPDEGTFVVDSTELFGALEGDTRQKRSLGDMCRLLRIRAEHLHNAGNDARYTLLALKSMATGNQVDAQREERWPHQTATSAETASPLKVIHIPGDLDSDCSEPEDQWGD